MEDERRGMDGRRRKDEKEKGKDEGSCQGLKNEVEGKGKGGEGRGRISLP